MDAPPLVFTNRSWRSTAKRSNHWSDPGPNFKDTAWAAADSLGPVEGNVDCFQWSADAGMYGWPGYMGMSPWLRVCRLAPHEISHIYPGAGHFNHIASLTSLESVPAASTNAAGPADPPFSVSLPSAAPADAEAPSLLLDFGREVAGRLFVESASDRDALLSIAYGESELEAIATGLAPGNRGGNYLGTNLLEVAANGIARGPKSAFRYVRIRFLRGAPLAAFKSIRLEGIYYPVVAAGSFESSDPLLNRIWQSGAYTAHLCMQDGIWDAPKRDRGRWVGDLDVEGRVISTAFGDSFLMEDTLRRLVDGTPETQHVNGIPGYTALWVTSLWNLYQHAGDKAFIVSQHENLLRLLGRMDRDVDPKTHVLSTSPAGWGFVDWAPNLFGNTPDTRIGTDLQYIRAFREGAQLLREANDLQNSNRYADRAKTLIAAAQAAYLAPASSTVGSTWQLNALAVLDGVGVPASRATDNPIWTEVLSRVKQDSPTDQVVSPYFGAYILDAMASLNHSAEALAWIRTYWGGMLAEGATTLWESYDLHWPIGGSPLRWVLRLLFARYTVQWNLHD